MNGRTAHARKAVEIMDGWSAVMKRHSEDNAGLQAAWSGSTWARAAGIVHADYPNWEEAQVTRFKEMLRTAYLPAVRAQVPAYNGNWEPAMTDAAMGIAVFLEDQDLFHESVERFRARVPAYFYLRKDGTHPLAPPRAGIDSADKVKAYWFGQGTYTDGIAQETCRNLVHVGYALAASAHIAETAWHQGVDLYGGAGRAAQGGAGVPREVPARGRGPRVAVRRQGGAHHGSRPGGGAPALRGADRREAAVHPRAGREDAAGRDGRPDRGVGDAQPRGGRAGNRAEPGWPGVNPGWPGPWPGPAGPAHRVGA